MAQTSGTLTEGTNRSKCSRCGEYFTSVGTFERHRREGQCLNPGDVGMKIKELKGGTYWGFEMSEEDKKKLRG